METLIHQLEVREHEHGITQTMPTTTGGVRLFKRDHAGASITKTAMAIGYTFPNDSSDRLIFTYMVVRPSPSPACINITRSPYQGFLIKNQKLVATSSL